MIVVADDKFYRQKYDVTGMAVIFSGWVIRRIVINTTNMSIQK